MSESVWKFEYSVESEVPQEFAWGYWSDVRNWEDPPAKLEWDGPFRVGARLTTILPGQRLESVVRQIEEGRGARIEMEVMGATVTFEWRFEEVAERRTKITQTIGLSGPGAEKLVDQAKVLEQSAPEGMKRLARTMERSWMEKAC